MTVLEQTQDAPRTEEPTSARGKGGASAPSSFPYDLLRLLSRTLDDIEHVRIQSENRVRALQIRDEGVLEEIRGPVDAIAVAEKVTIAGLETLWKQHPLAPWAKGIQGVGPKSIARLLAETGDPLWRAVGHWEGSEEDREWVIDDWVPRTLAQLRSYAGHGDPARRRRKGMSQEEALRMGNPLVKKRLWLIATGGLKQMCPACKAKEPGCTCAETHVLRHVYVEARVKYSTRVETEGVRVGEPWRDGRQHAAAIREVGKYFLRILHAEASRLAA